MDWRICSQSTCSFDEVIILFLVIHAIVNEDSTMSFGLYFRVGVRVGEGCCRQWLKCFDELAIRS